MIHAANIFLLFLNDNYLNVHSSLNEWCSGEISIQINQYALKKYSLKYPLQISHHSLELLNNSHSWHIWSSDSLTEEYLDILVFGWTLSFASIAYKCRLIDERSRPITSLLKVYLWKWPRCFARNVFQKWRAPGSFVRRRNAIVTKTWNTNTGSMQSMGFVKRIFRLPRI